METKDKTTYIKTVLEEKKAEDIACLSLTGLSSLSDSFVIATGGAPSHVKALADEVIDRLDARGISPLRVEGYESARWILLDYDDVIVHIFNEEARRFYSLEWLWADAKRTD